MHINQEKGTVSANLLLNDTGQRLRPPESQTSQLSHQAMTRSNQSSERPSRFKHQSRILYSVLASALLGYMSLMISEDYQGWIEEQSPPMTIKFNNASDCGRESLTTSDTSDDPADSEQSMFSRLKKRGFFAAAQKHPTPTILNFARSADCQTYTFSWTYTFPTGAGAQKLFFDVQNCCISNLNSGWANLLSNVNYVSSTSLAYSALSGTYGYYIGKALGARYYVDSNALSDPSDYYALQSGTDIFMQKPGLMTAGPTITQTVAQLSFSWSVLSSTWTSSSSVIGTGNDDVYYALEYLISGSTWGAITSKSFTNALTFNVPMPDSRFAYGSTYSFRVTPENSCGISASTQPTSSYQVKSSAPTFMNTPTLVSASGNSLQLSWTSLTSDAQMGYRPITSYQLYYCLSGYTNWTLLTDANVNTYTQSPSPLTTTSGYMWSKTYNFKLKAVNVVGAGTDSSTLSVATPTIPATMTTLQCTSRSVSAIVFTWNALTTDAETGRHPITHYSLRYRLTTQTLETDYVYLTGSSGFTATTITQTSGFATGTQYNYQIRAENVPGIGAWSSNVVVQTPSVPVKMAIPLSTSIAPTQIVTSWTQLTSQADIGYDPILEYRLEKSSASTTGFATVCSSTGSSCTESFTMPAGTVYYYRVMARNSLGWGTYSDNLQITTDNYPDASVTLSQGTVDPQSITISWTSLPTANNGGDAITFYAVELYNPSTTLWNQLNTNYGNVYLTFTHTSASNFVASTYYQFRIRPKNGVGYSLSTSSTLSVLSDGLPNDMYAPTGGTVTPLSIQVSWAELLDTTKNGGDTPTYYKLEWYDQITNPSTPVWSELTAEANGKLLTFTHTRTAVFPTGSTQKYRILPKNRIGYGTVYSAELSVWADEVPIRMNNPTRNSVSPNRIKIQWTGISADTDTGRDAIVYYHVKWESSPTVWTTLTNWPTSTTILSQYTHQLTGSDIFPSGSTQNYKVCAQNGVGDGACGSVAITADAVPQDAPTPSISSSNINPTSIYLTWNEINSSNDGGDSVIYYILEWDQGTNQVSWAELSTYTNGMSINKLYTHTMASIFPSGQTNYYRISAKNGVGYGAPCTPVAVLCDEVPTYMNAPTNSSVIYNSITMNWVGITDTTHKGRDSIVYYSLEWFERPCYADANVACTTTYVEPTDGTWKEITSWSDTSTRLALTKTHTTSTYFSANKDFEYRMRAKNGVGTGVPSAITLVRTDDVPQQMAAPTLVQVVYSQVKLSWSSVTGNQEQGRDIITSYQVWWDKGTNDWVQLTTDSVQLLTVTYTHQLTGPNLPLNQDVYYKISATNRVGVGSLSPALTVLTPDVPQQMVAPTLVKVRYNQVQLSWSSVIDFQQTGRDALKSYQVWWDKGASDWVQLTTDTVQVLSTTFTHQFTGPNLPINQNVYYKISATNGMGVSPISPALTVLTPNVPTFMNKPSATSISANSIVLAWTALDNSTQWEQQGRDEITYYTIECDPSTVGGTFTALNPTGAMVATYTQSSGSNPFPANKQYRYQVRARNGQGDGTYSDILTITTDDIPIQARNLALVSTAPKVIMVSWDAFTLDVDTGRDPIIYYRLEYFSNSTYATWLELTSSIAAPVTTFTYTLSTPFPANQDQSDYFVSFRVTAINSVGEGPVSTNLDVLTKTFPRQMAKVTIDDPTPQLIKIRWNLLTTSNADTGRDPVVHYKVLWNKVESPLTETWIELSTYPNMASTLDVTSGFLLDTTYRVKIAAQNGVGIATYSDTEEVLTDNVPVRMNTPTEDPSTNATYIKVIWEPITLPEDTGRDDVIHYKLEWDQGKNQWQSAGISNSQLRTSWTFDTKDDGVKNGTTYKFRVTPKNKAGFGVTSSVLSVIPSSPPNKMNKVRVTLQNAETAVKFDWDYPSCDNGNAVNEYLLEIKDSGGTYQPFTTTCDGADPTIVTNRYCYVEMAVLRASPFDLAKSDKIIVRAKAKNIKGFNDTYSDTTPSSFTTVVEIEPDAPDAPLKGADTKYNVIHTYWTKFTDFSLPAGGVTSAIQSYHLQRNEGNNTDSGSTTDTWLDLNGLSPLSLINDFETSTDIVGGTTYKVRVRALNKHGWGPWSQFLSIRCARVPDVSSWITTDNSTTNFNIQWNLPFNGGLQIERYYIRIMKKGSATQMLDPNNWFEDLDNCDGSNPAVNASQSCMVPMQTLRNSPFFYGLNDNIRVRVWVENLEGISAYTDLALVQPGNNAIIQTEPTAPSVAIFNFVDVTTDLQIKISWTPHTTNNQQGGYAVSAYEIQWTDSVFDWELLYNDNSMPFTAVYLYNKILATDMSNPANRIVPGTLYKFRYRAINIHGPSAWSAETPIYASTKPDKMNAPSTSLYNQTVTITWDYTPNDHAQVVTKYAIRFKTSAGAYIEDTNCNGQASATIVSSRSCVMSMTRFTGSTYNLQIDDLIQVTLEAYNIMGWSGQSSPNVLGVTAKKNPQKVVSNVDRGPLTAKTAIHITWTGISDNVDTGGQAVDYKINYDKASGGTTWVQLIGSTNNITSYFENSSNFKTGNLYQFRIVPWNDFGNGQFWSNAFGIWAAIVPSGLAAPTTTLNYMTYVDEDDIVVIDWEPPTDNGGLSVWYSIEVRGKSGAWIALNLNTECYELALTTNYNMPFFSTTDAITRCTVLVSNLKSKYLLDVGDTVVSRITATQQVGFVTSDPGGTAVLPSIPCFRTTYPRVIAGVTGDTAITAMDVDDKGHIVVGGRTSDSGLLLKTPTQNLPFAAYIAKGNYYAWAKFFEATDGSASNTNQYTQVLDITFRYDGERCAVALERTGFYDMSYMIAVLNKDGTFYSAFRENAANARGKVNITGMLFDSSNFITLGLDFSPDGTDLKRQAVLTRFTAGSIANPTFNTQFYLVGGSQSSNVISQMFALQRIRTDSSNIYMSGMITDSTGTRRVFLGKSAVSNGAMARYYVYTPGSTYNTDKDVAVVRRMSLYENELTTQHIISTCMMSFDGYRIHFGQFVFTGAAGTSAPVVMTPTPESSNNRYFCLGMYQRELGLAYTLFNDRRDNNPANYKLILGKVSYTNSKIEIIPVANHFGTNNYFGAKFVHMMRFYYWGQSKQLYGKPSSTFTYSKYAGFLNLFDQQEVPYSCNPSSQTYTFPATGFINLGAVTAPLIDWKISTGLTTTTGFANSVIKQIRVVQSSANFVVSNLNLKEPLTNNTWCPIMTNIAPATITVPDIPNQMFTYNPDTLASQFQSFQFNPIQISKDCPDLVIYNLTYLTTTNGPFPSFIKFTPENNSYVLEVATTDHVGTYEMVLYSTLGNNMTSFDRFTTQVASPCLGNFVQIIAPTIIPIYDISLWDPMYIDLNWLVSNFTPSCGSLYFNFKLLNGTNLGAIEPNIFSVVNTTSGPQTGLQKLKIWTQAIPSAKLWNDLMIEARLQGDLVATYVFTIDITNDCGVTTISPQVMPDKTYYTGRDPIDLTFVWTETVGKCGPISYKILDYQSTNVASNSTLDSSIFTYPSVVGTNNTLKIFTADETKVGTYKIRVYASLGTGGYKQEFTLFSVIIIRDPCAYYTFTVPLIEDLTLWINQTAQTVQVPFFQMIDTAWICNFTYLFTNGNGGSVDPIFKKTEVVKQGVGPSIQLDTTDVTKVDLSPYTIKLKGWPTRQPNTVAQTIQFRVFIAFLDKTDCPTGKYYKLESETCEPCQSPCSACKDSPNSCTWCVDGQTVVNDGVSQSCILKTANCPMGTVRDPYLNQCNKCTEFCKTCASSNTCTQCITNYNLAGGKCYPFRECPPGFMFDNVQCVQCPSDCQSCQSASVCAYCNQDYFLDSQTGQCVATCPAGYYGDKQSRLCMVCAPQCATCKDTNFTCTSCRDLGTPAAPIYMYLFENKCVDRCPYLNYYQNFNARTCDKCKAECKICVNAINDCIVCNTGSVISGRECLNSCPERSYITIIGTCFACDPQCKVCYGAMNSMCTQCNATNYLTETTCEKTCNPPLFADVDSGMCKQCPYYCNSCQKPTDCQKCKTGYIQRPDDCEGENFLRITPTTFMTVPMNPALTEFNPREMTTEIWLKIDNVLSSVNEIILGTSPYKIRKKANVAQIQLNFDSFTYCDSFNLKGGQWYHYAYAISEDLQMLSCYVNGEKILIGTTMMRIITADIIKFKEITFGFSIEAKSSESKFTGYVKEFRWWNTYRTQFQIMNFKEIAFSTAPTQMVAYWRLNEDRKNQVEFKDSKTPSLIYNPMNNVANPQALKDVVEMLEIYLKMCPEGTYGEFNETSGVQECYKCDPLCMNCNGNTNRSCTDCNKPLKLIEAEQRCVDVEGCPEGYYEDKNKECQPCHEFCISCVNTPTYCPKCKPMYFKQYNGVGCTDQCPRGRYGNYMTQSCSANPVVTSLYPDDGLMFEYGTFIDLFATFQTFNNESLSTYTYGWIITKLSEDMDLAKDAAKPYYGTDITRVHLDNNIIQPNFYYNITFYVKGKDAFYNGMRGSTFNVIFIGIPPKNGKCTINPPQGIATVTQFTISSNDWVENEGIAEYTFFFSLDEGFTYIPMESTNLRLPSINVTFEAVFKTMNVQLKCTARNIKGFSNSAYSSFVLMKRSSSNPVTELSKFDISKVANEDQTVIKQSKLVQIAQEIAQNKKPQVDLFDPKVLPDQCNDALCSYAGQCRYDQYVKKYYCECSPGRGGFNCTFKNITQLNIMKNFTLELAKFYQPLSLSGYRTFDFEFLNLVTSSKDLMSDDTFDAIQAIVNNQVQRMMTSRFTVGDNSDAQTSLQIVSNMIEYLQDQNFKLNMTQGWANISDPAAKKAELAAKMEGMVNLTSQIRNSTRNRLSFLQTQVALQSRMVSFRQILTKADSILTIPATSNIKKALQTFVKISPANFANNSAINLGKEFVAEVIEYAVNPYQLNNTDNIAVNVFEVNLYNFSKTVTETLTSKVDIQNLSTPIEFAFPVNENHNLTEFAFMYNQLNPFKYKEKARKQQMIDKSNLSCVYWNETGKAWSSKGCQLMSIDKTHIKCNCSHLSSFAVQFVTPKLVTEAPLLENSTLKAQSQEAKALELKDIIMWPLDKYFNNMYELWQHNRPSLISFIIKPGCIVLVLFWAMYLSSLIYYSGRDDLMRFKMTKQQNRDDLAEIRNDEVQNVHQVVRDLIVQDFLHDHGKYIKRESRRAMKDTLTRVPIQPPKMKIFEQLTKEEQKAYKKRARKKVFGIPAGLCDRAKRIYDNTMSHNTKNPNAKMSFFNEELKNNIWIGLIAKTSKIAPRHVRLLLMYFYASLYIMAVTIIFAFQIQEMITDNALFQVVALAVFLIPSVWIFTIPVALIFRMPLELRRMVSGVKTKKINKAFKELDVHMGWRYAVGYFICLTTYFIMSVFVIVFNIFYPHSYVMGWAFVIILLYILDLIFFTFALAGLQMVNIIISTKVKCWYKVWAAIEVFRYVKNLRG